MKKSDLRKLIQPLFPIVDVLFSPFTFLSAALLLIIRKIRVSNMPLSKSIFKHIGVFPIADHYYEPLFNDRHLKKPLNENRNLPGIEWNLDAQVKLLQEFRFQDELLKFPIKKLNNELSFYFDNPSLGPGDAEFLYSIVRHLKPKRFIEIGSGFSTLMTKAALEKNGEENDTYHCEMICIEPYEMPWLEKTGVQVIRKLVEDVDMSLFQRLCENDILFIDSSHMIRPQGDVLFEFLELLPTLKPGVVIHIHDIFSPEDYTKRHLIDEVLFWNEQYLLEAFLSCNSQFEIIGALNFLKHKYADVLMNKFPVLKSHPQRVPGSFWIKKTV